MTDDELTKRFDEMIGLIRGVETTMLKEFRKWSARFTPRVESGLAINKSFEERLEMVESRLDNLEKGLGNDSSAKSE